MKCSSKTCRVGCGRQGAEVSGFALGFVFVEGGAGCLREDSQDAEESDSAMPPDQTRGRTGDRGQGSDLVVVLALPFLFFAINKFKMEYSTCVVREI